MFGSVKVLTFLTYALRIGLLATLLYYFMVFMGWNYLFAVNRISIEPLGGQPLRYFKVNPLYLSGTLKGNFFNVNLYPLQAALLQMPWVAKVRIKRVFPNTIKVYVKEYKALGRWGNNFVSEKGVMFRLPEKQRKNMPKDIPIFSGDDNYLVRAVAFYHDWMPVFRQINWRLTKVEVSKRNAWKLHIASPTHKEVEVVLGRDSHYDPGLKKRLSNLVLGLPTLGQRFPRLGYIDLRYATGVALRNRSQH